MKLKTKLISICGIFLVLMLLSSVQAATDGITGSTNGAVMLKGQVTKDITNINSLFDGITGSNTYSILDNSTGLSNIRLLSGEYTDSAGADQYGNISLYPHQVISSVYNSTGNLDKSEYTETDSGSIMSVTYDTIQSVTTQADSLRLYSVHSAQTYVPSLKKDFTASVSMQKYFVFGMYINTNTLNSSTDFQIALWENPGATGKAIVLRFNSGTAWSHSNSGGNYEYVNFPSTGSSDVFIQMKLSDIDGLESLNTFTSIGSIQLSINPNSEKTTGVFSADIYALEFTDDIAKLGYDRTDQVSAANDFVALNYSTSELKVRELDSKISYVTDATIDFVADVSSTDVYDPDDYRVTKDYTFKLGTPATWQDDVIFSNLAVYHVLEADYTDYTSYSFESTDLSTSILNEEPGDVIVASSSISEDVEYTLKYQVQYTQAAYDALIASESMSWTDWLQYGFWAVLAFLIPITFFQDKASSSKRRGKTRSANRK